MIKRKKTFVLLLLPVLAMNFAAIAEKACSAGDESGWMPCCTDRAGYNQEKAGFVTPESCKCQIIDNSDSGNQAAILPYIFKPNSKDGAKFLVDAKLSALILNQNISACHLNHTTKSLSFSNIKIYDLNASYLI